MSAQPTAGAMRAASLIRPLHGFKAIPDDKSLLIGEAQIIDRETGAAELAAALTFAANKLRTLQEWKASPGGHEVTVAELAELETSARAAIASATEGGE